MSIVNDVTDRNPHCPDCGSRTCDSGPLCPACEDIEVPYEDTDNRLGGWDTLND